MAVMPGQALDAGRSTTPTGLARDSARPVAHRGSGWAEARASIPGLRHLTQHFSLWPAKRVPRSGVVAIALVWRRN